MLYLLNYQLTTHFRRDMSDFLQNEVRKFVEKMNSELKEKAEENYKYYRGERTRIQRESGRGSINQANWRAKYGGIRPAYLKNMSEYEKDLIESFYKNRPLGMHVDHIIPLSRGGKHRIFKLQYLPAAENISKKNRMPKWMFILKSYHFLYSIALTFSLFRKIRGKM